MIDIGYALSSEEHAPKDLVAAAMRAEEVGFSFALISDHYHPWIDRQGNSSFVWSVIGAIAQATTKLRLGTGVTCPTTRIHPAIIAQAAATASLLMEGRFFLGVGSGENLNEHILGDKWQPADIRHEMLEEAVSVIRHLWLGGMQSHDGRYYEVQNARIYSLPEEPPDIYVAAAGTKSAELAGRIGDGLISTAPKAEIIQSFAASGGDDNPCYGQLTVCWASDEKEARRTVCEWWPNVAIGGELSQELPLPAHFEQAVKKVKEEEVCEEIPCGPDPAQHLKALDEYAKAGFTHVYVHQIGPDQNGFFDFYQRKILPEFQKQLA